MIVEQDNKINFFGRYFRLAFLFVILAEIFSYCAYFYNFFNPVVFFAIIFLTLVLSFVKLEYGVYIILAELFIGSKGYLFSLPFGGLDLSLRMGLFLVVLSVWLFKAVKDKDNYFTIRKSKFFKSYAILAGFILLGALIGFTSGNVFIDVFFDFNAWIYFILVLPFYDAIKSKEQIANIFQILFACLLALSLKIIFLFYIFSHQMEIAMLSLYSWTRKSGVGEITMLNLNFYRIFFQSQIYSLIGFFILLPLFYKKIIQREKDYFTFFDLLLVCGISLLVSFSRSFWVGLLSGFIALFFIFKFYFKERWRNILKISYYILAVFLISAFLIVFLINFPRKGALQDSFGSLIQKRIQESGQEAGGKSRMDLLPPLFLAIAKHPFLGSGFGATVTYRSSDPRILEKEKEGWYTTYAFEWGYLDIWLKIGFFGLAAYLFLIWKMLKEGWKKIFNQPLIFGMLLGLLTLLATNFFSPYLNHPLGIGYLILCGIVFERMEE